MFVQVAQYWSWNVPHHPKVAYTPPLFSFRFHTWDVSIVYPFHEPTPQILSCCALGSHGARCSYVCEWMVTYILQMKTKKCETEKTSKQKTNKQKNSYKQKTFNVCPTFRRINHLFTAAVTILKACLWFFQTMYASSRQNALSTSFTSINRDVVWWSGGIPL